MKTRYCSICSTSFDREIEGEEGSFGMIQFAFCGTCKVGLIEWVKHMLEPEPEPCQHPRRYWSEEKDGRVCLDCGDVWRGD